ncbi:50S ribosomal protein L33 [Candidatus Roizmanbacteria bacterium RIFCSPLOWO2_02_FULL_38_10]|uniref:Large ribosomal subunit protein bL33 n=1 Tax=Candidatus Roizmanbacteria bacterium RIFCSPLOWO2_02_FULL_38_10 TaxID=1802074 RepID=A0A1F7JKA5_9BACT|nr:MAG: 50S ribosomal protein L33 [Candidatus Roizmanbacteria bacterium RIFCSPLOWO2_02_FULL_38_10]
MAKKGNRIKVGLICTVCKRHNYVTEKNKLNTSEPLKFKKYCLKCRKKTEHKEKKKLD